MKKLLLLACLGVLTACGPSEQDIRNYNNTTKRLDNQIKKIEECIYYLSKCEEYDDPNVCQEQNDLINLEMGVYDTYVASLKSSSNSGAIEGSEKVLEDADNTKQRLFKLWEETKP